MNRLNVTLNNKQVNVHPYIAKIFEQMSGYRRGLRDVAGLVDDSAIDALLHSVPTTLANGANTFIFDTTYDLNTIHPLSVAGILPTFSTSSKIQVTLNTPTALTGSDPLDNVISVAGGAVASINTANSTVDVIVMYKDMQSFATTTALQPDLTGLPTAQTIQLPGVSTAIGNNQYNSFKVNNPYKFYRVVNLFIDGNQSNKFMNVSNLTGVSYFKADNNSSAILQMDETTGGVQTYFKDVRAKWGQDLDEGVFVWDGPSNGSPNSSGRSGQQFMDLTSSGYPAMRFALKTSGAVGSVCQPRIVSFGVYLNDAGIGSI